MDIKNLIKISRPRFWLYLVGTFLLGIVYGLNNLNDINFILIYGLFFFLIPANIYLYGINDLFDKDTDKYNLKKKTKEHKLKNNESSSLILILFFCIFLLIPLLILSDLNGKIILIVWLLLSTFYSGFIRFKAIPFLDFMSNMLYVMPGVYAYYYLTKSLPSLVILLALFFWAWSMHLYSAIPDIKSDKKANIITTAVLIGKKYSLLLCLFFWLFFSLIILLNFYPYGLIALIYPLMVVYSFYKIKKIDEIYWYFPYVNAIIGFLGFLHGALIYG
jgi:lycopene elongase/hydratase (dihydrobisanhydrobacterioruberin-forming)